MTASPSAAMMGFGNACHCWTTRSSIQMVTNLALRLGCTVPVADLVLGLAHLMHFLVTLSNQLSYATRLFLPGAVFDSGTTSQSQEKQTL